MMMRRCLVRRLDGSILREFDAPVDTPWALCLSADFASEELRIVHNGEVVFPSNALVPIGSGTLDLTIVRFVDSRCVRLVVACDIGASRMQWFRLRKQDVPLQEITDMGLDPKTCKIGQVLSAFTRQSHRGRLESAMVEWLLTATAPGPVRRRKLWEFLTPDGGFALQLVITRSEVCLRQRAFEHHGHASVTVNEDEGGGFLLKGGFGVAWLAAFSVLRGCCNFFVLLLCCCLLVDSCFLQYAFRFMSAASPLLLSLFSRCLLSYRTCCLRHFAFHFLLGPRLVSWSFGTPGALAKFPSGPWQNIRLVQSVAGLRFPGHLVE